MITKTKTLLNDGPELQENNPNAAIVIRGLRYLDYSNEAAICDLTDNAIDGGASRVDLEIKQDGDSLLFRLTDNGRGMDLEEIDQALRLGSKTQRDPSKDLGFYGMGLVTASIAIARRIVVLSRKAGNPVYISIFDIDEVYKTERWDNLRGKASKADVEHFNKIIGAGNSGTIVTLSKVEVERLRFKPDVEKYVETMIKEYGRIYRYFLGTPSRLELYVNGVKVKPIDPLLLDDDGTKIVYDDTVSYTTKAGSSEDIRIRLVKIGREKDVNLPLNQKNQGIYIMRNHREISKAETLGLFVRHNYLNRIRCEIFVNGLLDDDLGINFEKKNINLKQGLRHKLENLLQNRISSLRNEQSKISRKKAADEIDHEKSVKKIKQRSKLLIQPEVLEPKLKQAAEQHKNHKNYDDLGCEFKAENLGRQGQIYEAENNGSKIIITWNVDHPFYDRFVIKNSEDSKLTSAVDFLIFCMAAAETGYSNDPEMKNIFTNFKTLISANMRNLLD